MRHRFFQKRLEAFAASGPAVLVNLGAGFTSYPFLLESALATIEVDLPGVVETKSARMRELREAGVLESRCVTQVAADLNDASDRNRLVSLLHSELAGARSFVLMEGISYYLEPAVLESLFAAMARCQTPGSVLALDYWPAALDRHPVLIRLRSFFSKKFGFDSSRYNLFDLDRITAVPGYRLREASHAAEQERVFASTNIMQDTGTILWEQYAVLEHE